MGGLSFVSALSLSCMLLLLLLLRVGKFADIGELPVNLKNWLLVDDGGCVLCGQLLLELFVPGTVVASTWLVVLGQDRWPVVFSALEEPVEL